MRLSRIMAVLTAATATAVVAGCGSSSGAKTGSAPVTPAATSSPASPSAPGTPVAASGITGQTVCDAVSASQVEAALGSPVGPGKPAEPKKSIHACGWTATDGKNALVAIIFDDAFDKNFVDDDVVGFTNGIAGTAFETATNTTVDVGARNVTVYGLSSPTGRVKYSGLASIANTLNDLIVDKDKAAKG